VDIEEAHAKTWALVAAAPGAEIRDAIEADRHGVEPMRAGINAANHVERIGQRRLAARCDGDQQRADEGG
jgi:hypothetical protein